MINPIKPALVGLIVYSCWEALWQRARLRHQLPSPPQTGADSFDPTGLRGDYRIDPLGVDATQLRLDWTLRPAKSTARDLSQSAYRILVAPSSELLTRDQGGLWDSGVVASNQMNQIPYEGKMPSANQTCWWKVRVWDQTRVPPGVPVAQETTGVLSADDWHGAKWIGAPDANQPNDHKGPKSKYETVLIRHECTVKPGLSESGQPILRSPRVNSCAVYQVCSGDYTWNSDV